MDIHHVVFGEHGDPVGVLGQVLSQRRSPIGSRGRLRSDRREAVDLSARVRILVNHGDGQAPLGQRDRCCHAGGTGSDDDQAGGL